MEDKNRTQDIHHLTYRPGDLIIKENDFGISVYKIVKGQVEIVTESEGKEIQLAILGPGQVIGEMILWQAGEGERIASVTAEGPTILGLLDTDRIIGEFESLSPRLKSLLKSLILKLNETTKKVVSLAAETV